jgi:hypothetical protein
MTHNIVIFLFFYIKAYDIVKYMNFFLPMITFSCEVVILIIKRNFENQNPIGCM